MCVHELVNVPATQALSRRAVPQSGVAVAAAQSGPPKFRRETSDMYSIDQGQEDDDQGTHVTEHFDLPRQSTHFHSTEWLCLCV